MSRTRIALAQASFDVVPTDSGPVFIDANRFPEGQLTHEVNSDGEYSRRIGILLAAKLDGENNTRLHLAANRSWARNAGLNFGPIYAIGEELILRRALRSQRIEAELTVDKGMNGIAIQNGATRYGNTPTTVFNYADFEIMRSMSEIVPDLLTIRNFFVRIGAGESVADGLINLPSSAHLPPQLPESIKRKLAGSFMRKEQIYKRLDTNGIATPERVLVDLSAQTRQEARETIRKALSDMGQLVVKTNEAGGRAVAVNIVSNAAEAEQALGSMMAYKSKFNISSWLVEKRQTGIIVNFEGRKLLVELTPLVVGERTMGESAVSVMAKYTQLDGGKAMPGTKPSFAYMDMEDGVPETAGKSLTDSIRDGALVTLKMASFAEVEHGVMGHLVEAPDEAMAIKEELRGSGVVERVSRSAEKAKAALEDTIDEAMLRLEKSMAEMDARELKSLLK